MGKIIGNLLVGNRAFSPPIAVSVYPSGDTYVRSDVGAGNYSGTTDLYVGELITGARVYRSFFAWNWAWLPASYTISSATFNWYLGTDLSNNARTMRIYRLLRAAVISQLTWNSWKTGSAWQTPGGFGALDCEQTDIANRAFSATEATGVYKDFTLPGTKVADFENGNGWLVKVDTEDADLYGFIAVDNPSNKPYIAMTYTVPLSLAKQYTAMGDSKSLAANNLWPAMLTNNLNIIQLQPYCQLTFPAISGATVATMQANIDATLAAITVGDADVIFCNIGVNDLLAGLPAEVTWKTNYLYILDAMRAKWPSATMYVTKPWCRTKTAESNTMAGWIDAIVASRAFCAAGDDERIWLEGGDDGVTNTSDGVHYSDAGDAVKVTQLLTLLGY